MAAMASATTQLPAKPRAYLRFLTSALHSRFIHAALIAFLLALDNAIILGPKHGLFWSWVWFGLAVIRVLLFSFTSLMVFFLQIATLEVGKPAYTSPFTRFRSTVLSFAAGQTVLWYLLSAWWFTLVYVWATPSLSMVEKGDLKSPDRLNERPIYIRTFVTLLALAQAARHLYCDHSALRIPIAPAPTPQAKDQRTHPIHEVFIQFKQHARPLLWRNLVIVGSVTIGGPFVYTALLRQIAWKVHLAFAKPWNDLSRSNARATGFPPLAGIIPKTFAIGMLLSLTWEISTLLFLTYLAQQPTKKDKPLSNASTDPNGTLLNGLKAKRDMVKSFAFWELALIAQGQPERRKVIFDDIDRATGPVWTSMLEEALKVIQGIDERIVGNQTNPVQPGMEERVESLPKLLPPPNNADVVGRTMPGPKTRRSRALGFVSEEAEKLGSSAQPFHSPVAKGAQAIAASGIVPATPLEQTILAVTSSPVGWFFTSTNAARVNSKVLGSPRGNPGLIVDAIESITKMLVASMQDDGFGKAIKGVPQAVKQFTKTVTLIDRLKQDRPPDDGDTTEVDIIYGRLKAGLTELLSAFQQFLFDTGLSVGELNDARKASGQNGIEAAKEQQTPAAVEDERQQRVVKVPKERERIEDETWKQWGTQRRQDGAARQPLFSQNALTRKPSRGASGINNDVIPRRREMEQVR